MPQFKKYKLGELVEFRNGKLISFRNERGNFPIFGGNGIVGFTDNYNSEDETLVVGRVGAYCGNVFYSKQKCWVTDNAIIGKVQNDNSPKYLYYLLSQLGLNNFRGGSSQPLLNQGTLNGIDVEVPSSITQTRIASILSSLDDKIELNRRTNHTLEQIAQTLFKKYGENEEFVKLDEIIELNPKLSIKKGEMATYVEMSNLPETEFSIKNNVQREFSGGSKFQNDDTLFARITPCLENGKTGFVDFLKENQVAFGSTEFIVMRAKKNVSKYYPYFIARDNLFRDYAIRSMVGTSGRQRVQTEMLLSFEVPQWDALQMKEFDISVAPIFKEIKSNSEKSMILSNIRDSLLPKLMSGEIEVNVAEKELVN